MTPIMFATERGHDAIADYLRAHTGSTGGAAGAVRRGDTTIEAAHITRTPPLHGLRPELLDHSPLCYAAPNRLSIGR